MKVNRTHLARICHRESARASVPKFAKQKQLRTSTHRQKKGLQVLVRKLLAIDRFPTSAITLGFTSLSENTQIRALLPLLTKVAALNPLHQSH